MATNDEIIKELQREKPDRIWESNEPALTNALNKARADGYKEGYKEALTKARIDIIKQLTELITRALDGVD